MNDKSNFPLYSGPAAGHVLAFKRAQSSLPAVQCSNRLGTFQQLSYQQIIGSSENIGEPKPKDEFNVTIHKDNIDQNAKLPSGPGKSRFAPKNEDKNLPAYEDKDVLIKGKTDEAKESRFATRLLAGLKKKTEDRDEEEPVNLFTI